MKQDKTSVKGERAGQRTANREQTSRNVAKAALAVMSEKEVLAILNGETASDERDDEEKFLSAVEQINADEYVMRVAQGTQDGLRIADVTTTVKESEPVVRKVSENEPEPEPGFDPERKFMPNPAEITAGVNVIMANSVKRDIANGTTVAEFVEKYPDMDYKKMVGLVGDDWFVEFYQRGTSAVDLQDIDSIHTVARFFGAANPSSEKTLDGLKFVREKIDAMPNNSVAEQQYREQSLARVDVLMSFAENFRNDNLENLKEFGLSEKEINDAVKAIEDRHGLVSELTVYYESRKKDSEG